MLESSSCGASFGNVKISDLDFADDFFHLCGDSVYIFGGPRGAEWGVGATGFTGFLGQNQDLGFH